MPAVAIPAVIGLVGVAASMKGAKDNAQATKDAQAANAQAVAETNALNYKRWLESKGVGDGGQAINFKLPRYMKWNSAAVANRQPNTYGAWAGGAATAPVVPTSPTL